MIPLDVLVAFVTAAVLLDFAPGPDNLFVLTQSALKGSLVGVTVTLGLCTGLIVHTTAVALGVAVIFQTSVIAFTALKFVGAGYLLYLAYRAFRASPADLADGDGKPFSFGRMYLRGVLMNVTNPKVAVFFLAFLPQFASPSRGSMMLQMFMFGGLFIVLALLTFSGIALASGWISRWLRRSTKSQVVLNRIAALVFIGLAIKLATVHR